MRLLNRVPEQFEIKSGRVPVVCMIMQSVFCLAARCADIAVSAPYLGRAGEQKQIGLNRVPEPAMGIVWRWCPFGCCAWLLAVHGGRPRACCVRLPPCSASMLSCPTLPLSPSAAPGWRSPHRCPGTGQHRQQPSRPDAARAEQGQGRLLGAEPDDPPQYAGVPACPLKPP